MSLWAILNKKICQNVKNLDKAELRDEIIETFPNDMLYNHIVRRGQLFQELLLKFLE